MLLLVRIITKYIRLAQANLTKRKDHTNDNNASNLSLIEGMLLQKMTNEEIAATILDMLLIGVNSVGACDFIQMAEDEIHHFQLALVFPD